MDLDRAKQVAHKITELLFLVAEYTAKYGHSKPSHDSTDAVWDIAKDIYDKEMEVLSLLDVDAITSGNVMIGFRGQYKDFHSGQSVKILNGLAYHLVYWGYQKEAGKPVQESLLINAQCTISRALNPNAVREVIKNTM